MERALCPHRPWGLGRAQAAHAAPVDTHSPARGARRKIAKKDKPRFTLAQLRELADVDHVHVAARIA